MKKSLLFFAAALLAANSHAYIAEISAGYSSSSDETDYDNGDKRTIDITAPALSGTLYFSPVEAQSDAPLAEAAFLSKSSFVNLNLLSGNIDFEDNEVGFAVDNFSADLSNNGLGARAVFNRFIIEAEVNKQSIELDSSETTNDSFRFGLGGYLSDRSTLVVSLFSETTEFDGQFPIDTAGVSGDLKFFIPLKNSQALSVGGRVSLAGVDDDTWDESGLQSSLHLFADYYLNRKLALNFAISSTAYIADIDADEESTSNSQSISFGSEYFILEQLSIFGAISVSTTEDEYDNGINTFTNDSSGTSFRFGIKGRI